MRYTLSILIFLLINSVNIYAANDILLPTNGIVDFSKLDTIENQTLNGEWRLFPQKFVAPEQIEEETDYIIIDVPTTWEYSKYKGEYLSPQTYATYYLKVLLPKSMNVFSLYIPDISSCYKLYINNELVTQMGDPSTTPENEVGKWKPTVVTYAPKTDTVELVFHVSNFQHNDGGMWESIKIGTPKNIYFMRILGLIRSILLIGILFAFTFYFVNFYIVVKPRNKSTLYLAITTLLALTREFITKDVLLQFLYDDFPFKIQVALEYITLCGLAIFLTEFIMYTFNSNKYVKYFKRLLDCCLTLVIFIVIFSPIMYYSSLVVYIQSIVLVNLLLILIVISVEVLRGNKEAIILFIGSILLIFFTSLEMAFINRFFTKSILFDIGIVIFILFLFFIVHIHNRLTNKAFIEASKSKDREVAFLRTQIVPHFINNALSNAIYLIEKNTDLAKKFLIELSNLMVNKYNFNIKNPSKEIPLKKELDIIRSYVYIQNIRFNNSISYHENIDDRTLDILIAPLLIQPLIENAIIHGLSNNDKPSSDLYLTTSLSKDILTITVEDNGNGINAQKLIKLESCEYNEDMGIGIKNIKERINNIKGSSFNIESKLGIKTVVTLKITV